MFSTAFDHLIPVELREASQGNLGLYPPHLRAEIDEMNDWVYTELNNGVYKVGFATTQESYVEHIYPLFGALDRLERHLEDRKSPYLFGEHITEADLRLYTTLIRFDVAYYPLFQCNLKSIRHDYPKLHDWLRRLYWDDKGHFRNTTDFDLVS